MWRFRVTQESSFPFVDMGHSAIAEPARKQEAGWAYLKFGG